jgi:anthranilate phosphoribosyltransferase
MLETLVEQIIEGTNLSEEQAENALEEILSAGSSDEEIARFLVALSEKGESAEEIAGFSRVMRKHSVQISSDHETLVDTAGTGGGVNTFNISTAAAFIIAGAGIPVAKHGNRAITSRSGSADVLRELGVDIERPAAVSEKALNKIGLCFMFAPLFHPAMKRVAQIRQKLGRRTIFNMIGPLTNPASAPFQVIGVYAEELAEKMGSALLRLGCERAWIVHGKDGMDEISISTETSVVEVAGSEMRSFTFNPVRRRLGVPAGGSPEENAQLILGVLEGRVAGSARDIVIINAAAALHVASGDRFSRSLEIAEESLKSGAALGKLRQLVETYAQ